MLRRLIIAACFLLALSMAPSSRAVESTASSLKACDQVAALTVAQKAAKNYCAGPNGCDFQIKWDNAAHEWLIIVSLIHSFDEQHRPRFMPEGFTFIRVAGNDCSQFKEDSPMPPPAEGGQ